jgi:hypothetical protein
MQAVAYFARIRQVCWRALCRVSDRHIFHEYFGQNGLNINQKYENIGQSKTKQTISHYKYSDQKHEKPTVALIERASRKCICLQTLKVDANDRSAQELQNGL